MNLYCGKTHFSFVFLCNTNSMFNNLILYLFIPIILIGVYWYIKSLKVNMYKKIYSVNSFSLLDILDFMFRFKFIISVIIFTIYIVNVINGLNVDYKGLLKIFDLLFEEGELINLMNSRFGIGMHYLDNIDGNFKGNKNSISNNVFAMINNDNENGNNNQNGNNPNHNENNPSQNKNNPNLNNRSVSPIDVTRMPRYFSPLEGANESSDEGGYESSSDESEKEPSEKNNSNPDYSQRLEKIDQLKLERRCLRMDIDDTIIQRNERLKSVFLKLRKAEIYEETKTIIPDNEPKPSSKRTWNDRDSDSDSDNDNRTTIVRHEPQVVKSKKARFMDPAEKKDFQDTLKIVEKKTRKIARLEMEHNKLGDKLDDYESNFEGKMNNITKGFNKAFSNNNKDNNNNN